MDQVRDGLRRLENGVRVKDLVDREGWRNMVEAVNLQAWAVEWPVTQ